MTILIIEWLYTQVINGGLQALQRLPVPQPVQHQHRPVLLLLRVVHLLRVQHQHQQQPVQQQHYNG